MAKYISANRNRGILKKLNIDIKRKKKNPYDNHYLEGNVGDKDYGTYTFIYLYLTLFTFNYHKLN